MQESNLKRGVDGSARRPFRRRFIARIAVPSSPLRAAAVSILRVPIALALAASLVSCAPRSHVAHLRPAVSGAIVEEGKPIPGVELFLGKFPGNDEPCADAGEIIPVSAQDRFAWTPVQERRLLDSLVNPLEVRGQITVLCIRHPAKGVLIGATLLMRQKEPVALRLFCDVARPRGGTAGPHATSAVPGRVQYCETRASRPGPAPR